MKNKKSLIFASVFLLLITLTFASSLGEVCCQQLKTGAWCQMAQQSDCKGTIFAPTSCDQTDFCRLGTCINEQSGTCSDNVPRSRCESVGGTFDTRTAAEISSCRNGCCQFGDWVAFSNKAECKQIASDYGVNYQFLEDVTNEFDCYALGFPQDQGACILNDTDATTCRVMSKADCNSAGGDFNDGFLCTAPQLESPCAKTSKTMVDSTDNKIYFIDSCRNKANIYDSSMYSTNPSAWTPKMIDYWTYIKKPEESCQITGASNTCGNCDPILSGTIGRSYKDAKENTVNSQLSAPIFGDYVCASMDCYYDTNNDGKKELYKNGEAWCAETPGTYPHIQFDLNDGFSNATKQALSNVEKYNLPGSEYVKLRCSDGEVIPEPCAYYRNEFCVEQKDTATGFSSAQCLANTGRDCIAITNREDCETTGLACRWIPGYRFDGTQTTDPDSRHNGIDDQTGKPIIDKGQTQGSCVPLIPVGMNESQENSDACTNLGSVTQAAAYETLALTTSRSAFQNAATCDTSGAGGKTRDSAIARCFQNCFLIPNYGKTSLHGDYMPLSQLYNVFKGDQGTNLKSLCVSDRRGYYCEGKTGAVSGASDNCFGRSPLPIYYTYIEWINSVKNRSESLGDCGYKPSAYTGYTGIDKNLETITVVYEKLTQSGGQKGKWGNQSTNAVIIYRGNDTVSTGWRSGSYTNALHNG